jgi:hypothetical protein
VAHQHLATAADAARSHSDDKIAGHMLAAQIELAAATLPPPSRPLDPKAPLGARPVHHLAAAITALDAIDPLDGPADLPLCAWHVHELARIARVSPSGPGGNAEQ